MARAVLHREQRSLSISVLLHTGIGWGLVPDWKIPYGFCRDKLSFPLVEGKEGNQPVLQQFFDGNCVPVPNDG